ncbi:MAG: acyl carrier protein [Planctomycetota bacterium]
MGTDENAVEVLLAYLRDSPTADEAFNADTDLLDSGKLDSLLVMDLVCFLENCFGVRMQPSDVDPRNLRSVRRIAEYVRARRSSDAAAV